MIIEIEYFKGDTLLYGKNIDAHALKKQLVDTEISYDKTEDNFISLLCRHFNWSVLNTNDMPDFRYDRDTGLLLKTNGGTRDDYD